MILYLAPLQGFTDYPFRNSYSKFFTGFDISIAPFISALPGGRFKKKEMRDVHLEKNHILPVIPQIMGNDPDDFVTVANRLYDHGYETVNWNLGCPYKMVAKKKRGSGLLCFPEDIRTFLEKALPMMKTTLSIKMRLGRHSEDEMYTLLPMLNDFPIDEITIHPRTGIQMYDGSVHLDYFEKALELSKHPVIYNGDITDLQSFKTLKDRFKGVDKWMIGRGVLSDPFLPMTIKKEYGIIQKDLTENKTSIVKKYHDDYYQRRLEYLCGPAHLTDRMKAFWFYLSGSFENGELFFKKVKKAKDTDQYYNLVEAFFDSEPEWICQ